jgi:hypothetical protein
MILLEIISSELNSKRGLITNQEVTRFISFQPHKIDLVLLIK